MPLEVYYRVSDGTDANGKPWEIGMLGTDVLVRTNGSLRLDAEQRDQFAKAWAAAELLAEAGGRWAPVDDLRRTVAKGQAHAGCWHCKDFRVQDVWPETASARARKHTRETGHETYVRYQHGTYYKPRVTA